ncbi:CitMHS family citrate-Mg2+:H+ or citrate-Ca2+:H+ symporter [Pseudonocardia hierapolitana]|uniref:CitMHS family citrate-Mg2+:H+ or citrate-Ca2+:H+ symporter n=1 Tax=Pseudonocardia hierapolitana TaxID=1128676 RepID=A0A561T356_9PSEU|nr:citrate:proton symporter [Pseudonocardia hierapolitana]TWF81541.1 CitMHS family citrate-Mg2+:H+ or citrate-Ca2+:H+ symporter [Pseudonocardia hierapolitana]
MLAVAGFLTIAAFLVAVLSQRVSVFIALTALPIVAALVVGAGDRLGELILAGFETVAPVAIMITFAVLYFCLMVDAGLFDPAVRRVVRWAGGDPLKITVGTAVLTLLVALDGDGASTFLITVSAMLPIYQRLGMRPLVLTAVVCLGAGVMNMVPWGGPTARAMAALDLTSGDLFVPVLPAMGAGILWVLVAAVLIGRAERKRIGTVSEPGVPAPVDAVPADAPGAAHAPSEPRTTADRVRFWLNVALTVALVVVLLAQLAELPVVFVVAFVLALLVNRPGWEAQKDLFTRHGHSVVLVTTMIFAAGVFTGVLGGTGMIEAMARALVGLVPDGAGGALPTLVAVTSMPLSLVFTPDAYYFGVLPVLAETSAALGGDPAEVARAAILGQMTTGFPLSPLTASTFILVGMAGVQLGAHQRFVFGWAFGTTLVMTVVALATGAIV